MYPGASEQSAPLRWRLRRRLIHWADALGRPLTLWLSLSFLAAVLFWQAGLNLFESGSQPAYQPQALHPPPVLEPITPLPDSLPLQLEKVRLGERLFHDPRLSHNNRVACATCHNLQKGGADGLKQSRGLSGEPTAMNTPSVFNSGFNFRQFWDGRVATLEEQIDGPIHEQKEMGSNWDEILAKLGREDGYVRQFRAIYPDGIRPDNIRNAIAEFERSLITPSRFDRYLRGDAGALSREEIAGYRLFKSYGCVACHQGVNVGGNMYQRLGVAHAYFGPSPVNPAHLGRMALTGRPDDLHVFKVPSLRNVALTAPYFHDGSVASLEAAVHLMARYQLGVTMPARDAALVVKFLHTLTGTVRGAAP
jgi:cytochrome c peroxidase